MNKEDIIRIAQDAGAELAELPRGDAWLFTDDKCLERFAAIVASAEREKIAEYIDRNLMSCREYAEAIRARGQA